MFFFCVYSVVGVVSRPLPIVVVVPAPSRSVLRLQVTARRPSRRFYGGSGLRLRRLRGDQVLQLRPPWSNSFLGRAGVGCAYLHERVCNFSLESLAGSGGHPRCICFVSPISVFAAGSQVTAFSFTLGGRSGTYSASKRARLRGTWPCFTHDLVRGAGVRLLSLHLLM